MRRSTRAMGASLVSRTSQGAPRQAVPRPFPVRTAATDCHNPPGDATTRLLPTLGAPRHRWLAFEHKQIDPHAARGRRRGVQPNPRQTTAVIDRRS
jgi:hypothetical protein